MLPGTTIQAVEDFCGLEAFDLELPDFVFLNQEGIFFLFELLYFRQLGIQVCDGDFQQRVFFRLFIDHIVDKQVGCRNGGNARQHLRRTSAF